MSWGRGSATLTWTWVAVGRIKSGWLRGKHGLSMWLDCFGKIEVILIWIQLTKY